MVHYSESQPQGSSNCGFYIRIFTVLLDWSFGLEREQNKETLSPHQALGEGQ